MEKYETEFKLKVVESFLAGEGGAKLLARRWALTLPWVASACVALTRASPWVRSLAAFCSGVANALAWVLSWLRSFASCSV